MKLETEYALSFYQELTALREKRDITVVKHVETGKLFVKKSLKIYDRSVYDFIREHKPAGVPIIEEIIEDDGVLTVIEEYITGRYVSELLQAKGPLPPEEVIDLASQLCGILAVFHSQQPPIVHRDIKPENLIVTHDGRLKLLDFNAAKVTSTSESRDTVLIGTVGYAAPEQYGFSASTPATDIYAIGVLISELLTGNKTLRPTASPLYAVIERCTEMNPADRFQSVTALKDALIKASSGRRPQETNWLPPGFRTGKPWKKVVAGFGYVSMLLLAFTMDVTNASSTAAVVVDHLCFWLMELSVVFLMFNFRGIQNHLPLTKNARIWVRILGVVLYAAVLVLIAAFISSSFETLSALMRG